MGHYKNAVFKLNLNEILELRTGTTNRRGG